MKVQNAGLERSSSCEQQRLRKSSSAFRRPSARQKRLRSRHGPLMGKGGTVAHPLARSAACSALNCAKRRIATHDSPPCRTRIV
eukprot:scaffold104488_cov32-Tisochrysis_lutea.AAC.1